MRNIKGSGPSDLVTEGDGPANEDLIAWSGNLAWVIDGATSLSARQVTNRPSDAIWLVERLSQSITERSESAASLSDILAESIDDVATAAGSEWSGTPEVPPSAAIGMVRLRERTVDFLVLADVSVITVTEAGAMEFCDDRVDRGNHVARSVMEEELSRSGDLQLARERVSPLLLDHRRNNMNVNGGYWVAALDPEAADHSLRGTMECCSEVLLATDGFVRALRPLNLYPNWESMLTPGTSLRSVADRIRKRESDDANCIAFPRWNTHDDLAAARFPLR